MDIRIQPLTGLPGHVVLAVDDTTQTTLDLNDPTHLVDEYTRAISYLLDAAAPPRDPLRVLHLGAGGLALARYVAATRPRSYQQAVELDQQVVDVVRRDAPLNKGVKVKIRVGDAREVLSRAPDDCYEIIIADVFGGPIIPAHVTTVEFLTEVARVLRPDGFFAANLCDGGDLRFARGVAAGVDAVFGDTAVLVESGVQKGRRFGNVVLFGGHTRLPISQIERRVAGNPFPTRLLHGSEFRGLLGGMQPTTDATARNSPKPPAGRLSW